MVDTRPGYIMESLRLNEPAIILPDGVSIMLFNVFRSEPLTFFILPFSLVMDWRAI
jgi:hypothetical protein